MLQENAVRFSSIDSWSDIIFLPLLQEPFNAEPPRSALITSYVTPVEYFYKRNHGPIPIVDDIERFLFQLCFNSIYVMNDRLTVPLLLDRYSVSVSGLIGNSKELFMKDIWCVLQI